MMTVNVNVNANVKIKICGLSRHEDIDYVNEARPDYCGFIINFPKSRRNVSLETLRELKARLATKITPVGVFVNSPVEVVAELLNDGVIEVAQLHGDESEAYITDLRARVTATAQVWKAFQLKANASEKIATAARSSADFILFDAGQGDGQTFEWTLLEKITRPFGLAGGLDASNIRDALKFFTGAKSASLKLVDVSSGVEGAAGVKCREKILEFVRIAREQARENCK